MFATIRQQDRTSVYYFPILHTQGLPKEVIDYNILQPSVGFAIVMEAVPTATHDSCL